MKVAIFRTSIPLTIFSVFHVTHHFCDARPVRNTEKWPKNAFWAPPNAGAVRLWSLSSRGRCRNPSPAYGKRVIECGDLPYLLLGPGTGATQYRCGNSKVLSAFRRKMVGLNFGDLIMPHSTGVKTPEALYLYKGKVRSQPLKNRAPPCTTTVCCC